MAIGIDSIIQWKLFQTLLGQQVLNVGYFVVVSESSPVVSLNGMAETLYTNWTTVLDSLVSTHLSFDRMELYEVNGLDFDIYSAPTPVVGVVGGDVLPPQDCVTVQLVRQTRATRHGYKRIAGISETIVTNGQLTTSAHASFGEGAQLMWGQTQTIASAENPTVTLGLSNIIWGGNDPAYPLGRFSAVADVVVDPWVRTQNTRKVGRGA